MARGPAKAFPDRKISETFLQFSAPLLHSLRCDASERQIREALAVAYTAWNAVTISSRMCSTTMVYRRGSTPYDQHRRAGHAYRADDRP